MAEKDRFELVSPYKPTGDQPAAIEKLAEGVLAGDKEQTLLGVTGSGKTFTMANVIARVNRPTLVLAHNKTLAAQLCSEFKEFFPNNAVEYFVSYYDYYQPEAYIPGTDTYIEKDSAINDEIEKLRHSATSSLSERRDVIIVASVSCIYTLGDPIDYRNMVISLRKGMTMERDYLTKKLVELQYERNDINFIRNKFRVRGDVVEIFPAYQSETAVRVEFFGDEVDRIAEINTVTGEVKNFVSHVAIYPASHYIVPADKMHDAIEDLRAEADERVKYFREQGKLIEAQRIAERTNYDIEMLTEIGFCKGIENYSRVLSRRPAGSVPYTLLDYFPEDFLLFVDESHVTLPQVRGMYGGDRSRKQTLVDYGFRLPSALDNRPLNFDEFSEKLNQIIYVSATPGELEKEHSTQIVEQVIRPTGLLDPMVEVRPVEGQIDDLLSEINARVAVGERVLVTTLTKKMAEDLTAYMENLGVRIRYMHHDVDTIERMELIRDLRLGEYDVLVGINLLREGPGYSGGVAGGDPRCGQGGLPAQRDFADPDHWPCRPKRPRQGHHVCRCGHRLDGAGHYRDAPSPGDPAEVQRGARHHPPDHQKGCPGDPGDLHQGIGRVQGEEEAHECRRTAGYDPAADAGDAECRQDAGIRACGLSA